MSEQEYRRALVEIAALREQTVFSRSRSSMDGDSAYMEGANAAFRRAADIAGDALTPAVDRDYLRCKCGHPQGAHLPHCQAGGATQEDTAWECTCREYRPAEERACANCGAIIEAYYAGHAWCIDCCREVHTTAWPPPRTPAHTPDGAE